MQLKLPLTLTLSPSDGAREDRSLCWGKSLNGESEHSAGSVLLLPFGRGEGRDEGFSRLHTYGLVMRMFMTGVFGATAVVAAARAAGAGKEKRAGQHEQKGGKAGVDAPKHASWLQCRDFC